MTPAVEGPPVEIVLAAVGDVLPHRRVKQVAARDGWAAVFGDTGPLLAGADLAFANLESPVAPDVPIPLQGEVFDAPADLPPALRALGIDVVSLANNHAWDQGPDGVAETWRRAREAGLGTVGAGPDRAAAEAPWIAEVRGVRVGFLAFADLSNLDGTTTPDRPTVVFSGPPCRRDCGPDRDAQKYELDLERLAAPIRALRAEVDVVVVSAHWGIEFTTAPLPEYPLLARALVDAGADVILGHHPHVLQPVARVGDAVVAYSLGNFVSNHAEGWTPDQPAARANLRDGVVLRVPVRLWPDGRREVGPPDAVLTWTENTPDLVRVVTLASREPGLDRRAAAAKILGIPTR